MLAASCIRLYRRANASRRKVAPILPDTLLLPLVDLLPLPAALAWVLFLTVGLVILLWAADLFTENASVLGRAAGMSPFLVGVTIVGIGTSLPELVSSVLAVLRGAGEIVMGNVIGSNIANLGLVLATAAIIGGRVQIRRRLIHLDLPFLAAATAILTVVCLGGVVGRIEALILIACVLVFLHFSINQPSYLEPDGSADDEAGADDASTRLALAVTLLLAGGALIFISADLVVRAVIGTADELGIQTDTLAATVVALGTSLPEVAVTMSAARRGQAELAVGNVIGSNIFNALAVTGVAALVAPVVVSPVMLTIGLPVMVAITAMTLFMLLALELTRWEGWLLGAVYVHFILWIAGLVQ